jgi:uncharacterized protein (TIRG00374 family)
VSAGGGRRRRLVTLSALAGGLALLGWLLHQAGLDAVWDRVRGLGWAAPLALAPYCLASVFDAWGWRLTLPARARIPFLGLTLARIAGEAVNSLTPAGAVGEPVKASLLRRWSVASGDAFASVVISKTALVGSQSLFTALGIVALLWRLDRPRLAIGWLVVLCAGCAAFTATLVWVQHRAPGTTLWKLVRRVAPRSRIVGRLEAGSVAFDRRLQEFYRGEPRTFLHASALHFLGWLLGVLEVVVMVQLIGGAVSWLDAFIIETLAQPIRAAAMIVPAGIGVQELGGVWLCTSLGMSEGDAVTLWLLKRARELCFDSVGVAYLVQRGGRRALQPG